MDNHMEEKKVGNMKNNDELNNVERNYEKKLGTKITLSFLLIITLTICILSVITYRQSYTMLVRNLANRSIKIGEYALTKIDVKEFENLNTVEDEKKESYNIMRENLNEIRQTAGAKYLYTMRKSEDGKYIFVIDGIGVGDANTSHIGDVDEEVDEGVEHANAGEIYLSKSIKVSSWGTFVSGYYPIKDNGGKTVGVIGVDYDVKEEYDAFLNYRMKLIIIAFALLIVTALLGIIISNRISKPIVKVTSLLNKTANLDLVYDASYESLLNHKTEIGSMVSALFETRATLRTLITIIRERSTSIDSEADALLAVSEEMVSSSENVTTAIQNIAQGTTLQSEDLITTTDVLNNFGKELTSIVEKIKGVDLNAKDMHFIANKSSNDMQNMIEVLNEITNSFSLFITKISTLGENINNINEITNVINSIADQTNLLALNASIEAARAGEAGKGFNVVAEEIRKLAEQSKISAENINSLIRGISKDTNAILETTDKMGSELNSQTMVTNIAMESFKQIIVALEEVIPKIDVVSVSAINVNSKKDTIFKKIDKICVVSQEISASSEEISASSEEMNSSTEEVAHAAENLSDMTKVMIEAISKFKL